MFEKLFNITATITRHRNAPYVKEREQYLAYCAKEGYAKATLRVIAGELLWAALKLSISPDPEIKINFEQIKAAAKGWKERERCCGHALNKRWTNDRFIRMTRKWFLFMGRLQEPLKESTPFLDLIENFVKWMEQERGLAPSTIERCSDCVRQFLNWYEDKKRAICEIEISDVDSFLAARGRKNWCRVTVANCAVSLRAFFRYAAMRGWCRSSIAEAIQAPRIFSQENLPSGPSWEDVRRLLVSMETEQPSDIRNRAIVMLFAVYGLRESEVCKLRLEDIDWEHEHILVPRVKRRQPQIYPLTPTVGNAIAKYLKEVRPQCCAQREVFLTLTPPFRPISRGGLYSLTSRRMIKLGLHSPHRGPHSLRHACATHLLSEGFSLKEIGDHLGHRSSSATRIYAKVNLTGLREVAKFDIGGLL